MELINSKAEIDQLYHSLSPQADALYHFVMRYSEYINQIKDYGTGELISMVEVHTLAIIEDSPGITVSQLALRWQRTKGAVSQNVTKLEKKGFVYRKKESGNTKTVHLYATESGLRLSSAHKLYDVKDIINTKQALLQRCTAEEVDAFFKVVAVYDDLMD